MKNSLLRQGALCRVGRRASERVKQVRGQTTCGTRSCLRRRLERHHACPLVLLIGQRCAMLGCEAWYRVNSGAIERSVSKMIDQWRVQSSVEGVLPWQVVPCCLVSQCGQWRVDEMEGEARAKKAKQKQSETEIISLLQ